MSLERQKSSASGQFTIKNIAKAALPDKQLALLRTLRELIRINRTLRQQYGDNDLKYPLEVLRNLAGRHIRRCPVCRYEGRFAPFGMPPRIEAQCPSCGSLERHRLLVLADRYRDIFDGTESLLHFAPEVHMARLLGRRFTEYVTADLYDHAADLQLDIEHMDLPNESFDAVLCSHVLEHVNDRKALREIRRILKKKGKLVVMIPIIEGWAQTYEDESIQDPAQRELHFGQSDHLRIYGADFRDRVREAGYRLSEYTAEGATAVRYRLKSGEKVFICEKT